MVRALNCSNLKIFDNKMGVNRNCRRLLLGRMEQAKSFQFYIVLSEKDLWPNLVRSKDVITKTNHASKVRKEKQKKLE